MQLAEQSKKLTAKVDGQQKLLPLESHLNMQQLKPSFGISLAPRFTTLKIFGLSIVLNRLLQSTKFKCPKISFAGGKPSCTCENPCSDAKYGRTVHLVMADNPRLFNDPPRSSEKWKLKYNARTSAERCNKRKKLDYKLEDGRYRSSRMWYCRLFSIMMCQLLDAWNLPKSSLKNLLGQAA